MAETQPPKTRLASLLTQSKALYDAMLPRRRNEICVFRPCNCAEYWRLQRCKDRSFVVQQTPFSTKYFISFVPEETINGIIKPLSLLDYSELSSQPKSSFLSKLPLEIRQIIYSYLSDAEHRWGIDWRDPKSQYDYPSPFSRGVWRHRFCTRVLEMASPITAMSSQLEQEESDFKYHISELESRGKAESVRQLQRLQMLTVCRQMWVSFSRHHAM